MNQKILKQKGITLIALVITVILLLILAGVTITIAINTGVMDKSEKTVETWKVEDYKERIELAKTEEFLNKSTDKLQEKLKALVVRNLEGEKNANWVKRVRTDETGNAELAEDEIEVLTTDGYIIIAKIEDNGQITWISVKKDNGEPYPTLTLNQKALEGTENENVKVEVKAEVEETKKTKNIAKIEVIQNGKVIETRSYDTLEVTDIFEIELKGEYIFKATTNQDQSTSKKLITNIEGTENKIEITAEPTTPRNTLKTEIQNGVATGPIKFKMEYGETNLKKLYKIDEGKWEEVTGTSKELEIKENCVIVAKYYDGINSFNVETYNIQNVDSISPTFSSYDATVSGATITATGTATDEASKGAATSTSGILRYEYSIDGTNYQTDDTFTVTTPGNYIVYIKAIDKAGNEAIETKSVTVEGYTVTLIKGTGISAVTVGTSTVIKGTSTTISATVNSGYITGSASGTNNLSGSVNRTMTNKYTFRGWTITSGSGTITSSSSASTTVTPTSNITIQAVARGFAYDNPVIPVGFKAVDTADAKWTDTNNDGAIDGWNNGLVIQDSSGNEFVWVPVDGSYVSYGKWCTISGSYTGDDAMPAKVTSIWSQNEQSQITKYGGFYIARYEAGIPSSLSTAQTTASADARNVSGTPVSKQNQVPWNYISYTQSKTNAESMYSTNYVQSGLVTGAMWDTTMKWLINSGVNVRTDSTAWGNYNNAPVTNITQYSTNYGASWTSVSSTTKGTSTNWLLKTGHSDYTKRKNIYDLAGNLWEWTSEIYSSKHLLRGAGCNSAGNFYGATSLYYGLSATDHKEAFGGFRVGLYIR